MTQPLPLTPYDDPADQAKLEKALKKVSRFPSGEKPLHKFLTEQRPRFKTANSLAIWKNDYEIDPDLIPSTEKSYVVWLHSGSGVRVPQIVYDALDLPDKTTIPDPKEKNSDNHEQ